ncbi:hypothetical protein KAR91_65540 [Candidatus Pacearchaeota archaeon]|nr:hypothetical protein [Candidatus Pacearchaeota archaeon]
MIEKKTINVVVCDICGQDDRKAQIRNVSYLHGLGYQPSNDDPLAQKFKKLYVKKDVCDKCQARMDHNFLGLSTEEKEQIVYSCLTEYDNRKDLRVGPERDMGGWPPFPFVIDPIDKMDKMEDAQEERSCEDYGKSYVIS